MNQRRPGRSAGARISEAQALKYAIEAEARAAEARKKQAADQNAPIDTTSTTSLAEPKHTYPSGRKSPVSLHFKPADVVDVETRINPEDPSPRYSTNNKK